MGSLGLYSRLTPMAKLDTQLLQAALVGYQHEQSMIEQKIADIQRQLGSGARRSVGSAPATTTSRKRTMGPAARKRIAAAQKKRWEAYHAAQGTASKPTPRRGKKSTGKRKLSPEGRARIAEAARKRWAALRVVKAS